MCHRDLESQKPRGGQGSEGTNLKKLAPIHRLYSLTCWLLFYFCIGCDLVRHSEKYREENIHVSTDKIYYISILVLFVIIFSIFFRNLDLSFYFRNNHLCSPIFCITLYFYCKCIYP